MPYPQANVPDFLAPGAFLKGLIAARDLIVEPPRIVAANDGVAVDAFIAEDGGALRVLQNCCIYPIKYAVDTDVAAESFHGILAGCTAQDDGLGSVVDLSRFKGRISVMATGGALRACTFNAYLPERIANP